MRLAGGVLEVRVWLASSSLPSSDQGIPLAEWEPIDLQIGADFPLQAPVASSGRDDFPELPHQPQGSRFCVRVPSSDWNPSAGMPGFLRAVISAYGYIALGTLEGKLQPWRPMKHYLGKGCVVVKADLPADQMCQDTLLCWAIGIKMREDRVDIIEWLDFRDNADSTDGLAHMLTEKLASVRTATPEAFLVPAVLTPQPMTFEYFNTLHKLLRWMERHGIERNKLLAQIICSARANQGHSNRQETDARYPCVFLGRAPADTHLTSAAKEARFAAAQLDLETVEHAATIGFDEKGDPPEPFKKRFSWVEVYDGRPETVRRRATGRPVAKLADLRLLVLGCGGLGAPIAEHCVRAGAAHVHIVDSGKVNPGILARQPYGDADIGKPKAEVLAHHLDQIYPDVEVTASAFNILASDIFSVENLGQYDLIIDATADRSVAVEIERSRRDGHTQWPSLITVAINQHATHGVAAVTPRGTIGAGVDLLRRLGLICCTSPELADVYSAFFPAAGRIIFRPEPGCSDSTFVGSSTDVSALAAQLLDSGLARLDLSTAPADGEPAQRSLSIVRLGTEGKSSAARVVRHGPSDLAVPDNRNLYQIRLSGYAMKCIRGHIKTSLDEGAGAGSGWTGGLLLGEFDDACGIAWVSQATGLPPCSTVKPLDMNLDVRVVRRVLEHRSRLSGGMITLVGFWKTQLGSAITMSDEDRQAMQEVVENPKRSPRMLFLVFGLPEDGSVGDPQTPWDPPLQAEAFTA